MSTAKLIGGYVYRQHVARVRSETARARGYIERLIDERPGPALTALYLAQVGLALGEIGDAVTSLDEIGRQCEAWSDKNGRRGVAGHSEAGERPAAKAL